VLVLPELYGEERPGGAVPAMRGKEAVKLLFLPFRILTVSVIILAGVVVLTLWWPLMVCKAVVEGVRDASR